MAKLTAFTMPKWGIEMSEGLVAEWMVKEGEDFARGTLLTLIETDKITNDIEAEQPGRFARILAEVGGTYPVGALLGVLTDGDVGAGEVDAFIAAFKPVDASFAGMEDDAPTVTAAAEAKPEPAAMAIADGVSISPAARARALATHCDVSQITGTGRKGRISLQDVDQALKAASSAARVGAFELTPLDDSFASPMARRIAARHGVALASLTGTGPRGRISKADVLAVCDIAPLEAVKPDFERMVMTPMRKAIARRLTEAKTTIPHFYVRRRVRADRLLALRAASPAPRASVNDYLLRACALALMEVPQVNIQVHGDTVHRFADADISVAVATDKGLITPVLRGANRLGLAEISVQVAALAQKARDGRLRPEEFEGGSFSLSNLGPFGVEQFDAIINPPQGAILAVGTARPEPIDDAGAIRIVPVLHLALSCDHRAIDGADGGLFLSALAALIENPERL